MKNGHKYAFQKRLAARNGEMEFFQTCNGMQDTSLAIDEGVYMPASPEVVQQPSFEQVKVWHMPPSTNVLHAIHAVAATRRQATQA